MIDVLWYLFLYALCIGYMWLVVSVMIDVGADEWWFPWVAGAVLPFFLLYENRRELLTALIGIVAAILFLALVWCVVELSRWVRVLL